MTSPPTAPIPAMIHGRMRPILVLFVEAHDLPLPDCPTDDDETGPRWQACRPTMLFLRRTAMCARRFLALIAILTLIFVGGAFALYQFGDQVLVRMATPQGHFREPPKGSGPDYSADTTWLAKPGIATNPSHWVPDGVVMTSAAQPAATFYVHPTTYLERDRWNAPIDPEGEPGQRARLFVESQSSAFNGASEIWAPKYRQAAYGAFLLTNEDAREALDLAYRDVLAAFDAFLKAQPADRPDHPRRAQSGLAAFVAIAGRPKGCAEGPPRRGISGRLAPVGQRRLARHGRYALRPP